MQPRSLLAPLLDVLADVRRCMSVEDYLITLDSTLFSRPSLFAAVSRAGHPVTIGAIDGTGESGTETALWLRLRDHLPLRRQVTIPGVGRVDVLVGERLIIEVDSRTHHARTPDYERDRRRDARASVRGYRVLRFTYTQVFSHWPSVEAAIMAAYLRGDHL
jgi:very-short-patch-repair endonuclease